MLALLVPGVGLGGGQAVGQVEVPDVVGETQAAGTTELETALFVVSVDTAYSPTIAAGLIISQDPAGLEFAPEGSTVTITVSLGAQPVVSDEQSGGGWAFHAAYEAHAAQRRKKQRELEEREEEAREIQDRLDREIALLLREQEAKDARRDELARLKALADQFQVAESSAIYGERVAKALERAIVKGGYSALEALDREIQRSMQEEEFMLLAITVILNEE